MTTAAAITNSLAEKSIVRDGEGAIYALAIDDYNAHCLTESTLDTWWANLSPEDKGDIFMLHLDTSGFDVPSAPILTEIAARVQAYSDSFHSLLNAPLRITEVPRG